MKHVLRLITVAVVLLLVVFGFYEYKRSHTTRETYPGIEDLAEKEPERKVTLLPIGGGEETVTRVENATGGDKVASNKNEGKTESKVTPQMLPTAAPTATPEPAVTPTVGPTATPVAENQVTEKEPKATPHVLAVENQPGVQEGWGKIKSSLAASLTMRSLPQQGAGSVKKVDGQKSTAVIISSDMPLKLYGLYEGEQGKIYRHVGVTYVGNEYYGYVLADRIEECAEGDVVLPTPTATAAPTQTPVWRPTTAPAPTNVPVWMPTATPVPTTRPVATATPIPTATTRPVATATPRPTAGPIWVPTATPRPTNAPVWVPTPTPIPIATATPVPTPTATPVPTATPLPTPTPRPTATPAPTATLVPTATPIPTATPVPVLERVTAGEYDYRVIPDKYNTGCSGSLTKINSACTVDGVAYSLGDNGNTVVIDLFYQEVNKESPQEVVIQDKDFFDKKFAIRHASMIDTKKIIRFENCIFKDVGLDYSQDNVVYYFENCSFRNVYGSNATFERCFFGGSGSDGLNPYQNVVVKDCYFGHYPQWNEDGIHTDAMQVYGKTDVKAKNIAFTNCRIEIPILDNSTNRIINACLMVALEYNDAQNFLFEECIINGGGYSIYATDHYGQWTLDNVIFRNISVGKGRLFGEIYPHIADGVVFDNVYSTEQLYVASVWRDSLGKIHLSVTNDTAEDRMLLVVTENGRQEIFIPCKSTAEAAGAKEYYDLPIDIEVVTADAGSSWVVCYDGEETAENQIRFVNWGYSEVYREVK